MGVLLSKTLFRLYGTMFFICKSMILFLFYIIAVPFTVCVAIMFVIWYIYTNLDERYERWQERKCSTKKN